MKQLFTLVVLWLAALPASAQVTDSLQTAGESGPLKLGAGVDVYYAYDFSEPIDQNRVYTTQAYRHNEFNLNWAYLQADYATGRVRATLALQTGTYVQANYAAEPNELTKLIAQANAGVKLREGMWLDAGILPSHIGYEATFSGDNELYTRALMAENSPYYETGARLTAAVAAQLTVRLLVLNGWQNIAETNHAKSLGMGITYTPAKQLTLSYNNYYGNEAPDSTAAKRRYFHNLYARFTASQKFTIAGSLDYGRQELWSSHDKGSWYAGMLIARYQLSPKVAVAGRAEHYNDKEQLIVVSGTPEGFQTSSFTLNITYAPTPIFLWRLEARGYQAEDKVFVGAEGATDKNLLLAASFAVKF